MISYCQEVQKQLGMQYRAPPLPIDFRNVNLKNLEGIGSDETESSTVVDSEKRKYENDDYADAHVQEFQNMARTRHHIFL